MEAAILTCLVYSPVALGLALWLTVRRLVRGHW